MRPALDYCGAKRAAIRERLERVNTLQVPGAAFVVGNRASRILQADANAICIRRANRINVLIEDIGAAEYDTPVIVEVPAGLEIKVVNRVDLRAFSITDTDATTLVEMFTEEVYAAHDIEVLADEPVTRQRPAMLGVVVLDVLDEIVTDRLNAPDQLLARYVNCVVGIGQRQVETCRCPQIERRGGDDVDTLMLYIDSVGVERNRARRSVRWVGW